MRRETIKPTSATSVGYTLLPEIFEITDFNLMLKPLLPDEVKVKITIDDNRLGSILTTNKTIKFTKITFFPYKIRFYLIVFRSVRGY